MYSIPVQTAIINSVVGNAVLAAIFFYLWRADRREKALGYWAAAYAASACRVGFRLAGLEGHQAAIYGEALFGSLAVVLLWMGMRMFIGRPFRSAWKAGLSAMAGMGGVTGLAAAGAIPILVPYLIAGAIFILVGLALLKHGGEHPGIGYSIVGFLIALYGGYVFVFSHLAAAPENPRAYLFGPIINLAIGMVMLLVTQRKHQFEAEKLNEALLREAAGRVAAEEVGNRSEQRYRAIVDTTRSLIGLLTPDGTVIDVNRATLERTGIGRDEAVGKPLWETPWWAHDAGQQQRLKQAIRRVAAGGHDRFESNHPAADGSIGHFNFFLTPIRDADGEVVYLVPEGHDITERRRIEQNLHAAELRFRAICEGSMLGVFVTDPHGGVVYFSRRATEITGLTEAEVLEGHVVERLHPEDVPVHKSQWRSAIAERRPFAGERRHMRPDGSFTWSRIHVAPIVEGQALLGFVATIEDINARKQSEQALRESEERFSSFFALSPEPAAVTQYPNGEYLKVNEAWERTFGYRQDEVVGRTALDLGLWVSAEDRLKAYEDIVRRNQARSGGLRLRRKDGEVLTVQIAARVLSIGQSKFILWGAHDITEHQRMEKALQESEERLSRVFYVLPDLVTISSLEEGRFVDMNHQWETMMGFTREEAIGRPTADFGIWVDPEQRQRLVEDVRRDGMVRSREIAIRRKDGQEMLCETSGSTFDWHGQRLLLLVTRDVTAQKRLERSRAEAEAGLRAREEMFSAIFHRSPVALGVTTIPDGIYLDVNESWERQFGYSRAGLLGRTSLDIGLWPNPEERRRLFSDLERSPQVQNREVLFRRGDGTEMLCELSGQVFDLNGAKALLWSAHDVTEHRRAQREIGELNLKLEARVQERTSKLERANAELGEALESLKLAQNELVRAEKLAALGSLVAGVAHELNTPIGNSVTVASTLHDKTREFGKAVAAGQLKRSVLDGYLDDARTASDLLLRSLTQANDLVSSFKQVAVDQTSAQRRRFDLKLVAEEVSVTLAPMLRKTPFKLDLDLADNVIMDSFPGSIGQVITNLVTNAIAHAFENRDHGLMQLKARRSGLHRVEMTFTDDGAGIPESDMKRVFDPFFTTKLGRGGSGLGLHIVYNLVTRVLGGRIEATSRVGVGTRFQISLPMMAPDNAERES